MGSGRYGDESLMRLDATLIGVNCCLFNGAETPYYKRAITFLTGCLNIWKPKATSAGRAGAQEGGRVGGARGAAAGRKGNDYRTPVRAQESEKSTYFEEQDGAAVAVRGHRSGQGGRGGGAAGMRGMEKQEEDRAREDDEDGDGDEEFVPTKRKCAAKCRNNKRARHGKERNSESEADDDSDGSDASWGKGGGGSDSSDEDAPRRRSVRSTRAERAGARGAAPKARGKCGAKKRRRHAVSSDEESSEGEFRGLVVV